MISKEILSVLLIVSMIVMVVQKHYYQYVIEQLRRELDQLRMGRKK